MYICPISNILRARAISLHSSKIVDKKEILRTVSNTGIHFSSDKAYSLPSVIHFRKYSPSTSMHFAPRVRT
jgi:hypothetical protein